MRLKEFLKITLIFLVECTNEKSETESKMGSVKTTFDPIEVTKKSIYLFNDTNLNHQTLVIQYPETKTLTIRYIGSQPKVLDIIRFSEDGETNVRETFLFGDKAGFPIVYTYQVGKDTSFQVMTSNKDVFSFLKNKEKIHFNELDSVTKRSKICTLSFLLLDYISHFPNLNYNVFQPVLCQIPLLITSLDSVPIRSKPDKQIEPRVFINQDVPLLFLDYSENKEIENIRMIWYKVSTEDGKTVGWVEGHSSYVRYNTDGD